jgi:flagellar biosynthesis/type III secretory pathway chaperone
MSLNSTNLCREALDQLLQMQLATVEEVNQYLVELKASIAQNDIEVMNSSLSENNLPIDKIETLEHRRNQLLIQYGFEASNEGLTECIKWCDDNVGSLSKRYQLLTDSLIQLQQSIQINALLVNKGQDRIKRSVSLLTGQVGYEKSSTYSKNGQTYDAINKRSISQA